CLTHSSARRRMERVLVCRLRPRSSTSTMGCWTSTPARDTERRSGSFCPRPPSRSSRMGGKSLSGERESLRPGRPEPPGNNSKMAKILIIEDDDSVATALRDLLKAEGFSVDMATDPVAGLANAQSKPYNVVVSDLQMPGLSGLDVVEQLQRARPH